MIPEDMDMLRREKQTEEILMSRLNPMEKVKQLMHMGLDEEDADEVVEKYQMGQMVPVYYEKLDFNEEYDE